MFNRRTKREIELELALKTEKAAVNEYARENAALRNQVDYLVRTVRKTDDIIFSMSQCLGWEQMRPRFSQLVEEMTARKVVESERINNLIVSELHKTYDAPPLIPQIEKKNNG